MRRCAGVLLTGGTSRRMGVDKATLVVGGETLARRAARVLAAVCDPVLEVGPGVSGLRAVQEDPPGAGPLAALLAGADALVTGGPVLLLACDLPYASPALLRLIADHPTVGSVVPTVAGANQYACSRWSRAAIAAARTVYGAGERAMHALLAAGDTTLIAADDRAVELADVDTPDDLRRLGLASRPTT